MPAVRYHCRQRNKVLTRSRADEIRDILEGNDSQSPNLGPRPVSHFDDERPIAFDTSKNSPPTASETLEEPTAPLPPNLETRKRRRESGPRLDVRRVSMFEPPVEEVQREPETKPIKIARTGAKRKFSVQEDEDAGNKVEADSEPFSFTRKPNASSTATEHTAEQQQTIMNRPVLSSSE